jgi:ubiquinone/menaquinone biosynthesis C-methylase UbiE
MRIWQQVERIDTSMPKHYFSQHLARYAFIRNKISHSNRVLDLGCGIGYGARSICESTKGLVGLDISVEAIQKAKTTYIHPKIQYVVAQGEQLPFPNASFDVVISFEVIEHLSPEHQSLYLSEIRRVLTSQGIAFLSTPNRKFTSGMANPYHLKEFYFDEFKRFLFEYFPFVEFYGQRCTSPVAKVYRGEMVNKVRKIKEFLGIQFLLPHWTKRILEFCLTGSTMNKVDIHDYQFTDKKVEECEIFLTLCYKNYSKRLY